MIQNTPERGGPAGLPKLRSLVVLNALLLLVLAAVTFGSAASAQGRVRGDYVMVAGGANGADGSLVYVVDTSNQEMMVVTYDHNSKRLNGVAYRNLAADATSLLRGRN